MAALGVAIMLMCTFIPIMTYAAPMIASVFLIPVMEESGRKYAWMSWAATAVLSLILIPDKEAAFFYLFLGYYPIVKTSFDKVRTGPGRAAVKLLYFTVSVGLMYLLIIKLLGFEEVMQEFSKYKTIGVTALVACMVILLMLYDRVFNKLVSMYKNRIKPLVKRMKR